MSAKYSSYDEIHELASLYALDALEETEKEAFELHLAGGCPDCERQVNSFGQVAAAVGELTPSEPPAALRDRLLSQMAGAPRSPGVLMERDGLLISRSSELEWLPLAPGIEFKPLYMDSDRRYNTCIVRMEAGARYPSHRHRDVEELFMLSGELNVAGRLMRASDYCRAGVDTVHGETFTDSGCIFLLIASQENELLG